MKHDLNKAATAYTKYVQASGQEYMDIEIPCIAASFIPSLIEIAEKQHQEIEGLEEQANEMAEKHVEKDIIMGNMQQEIERYKEYTEHLQQEIQWQYGKLNQISDLIERGRNESKKLFPGNTR